MNTAWQLSWSHGHGSVEVIGGMLGPVHFRLPDGRSVQPFAIFPWADEPPPPDQAALTGLMSRGRGEWPCVPFGRDPDMPETAWHPPIHGEPAHGAWERIDDQSDPARLQLRYRCAADGPIEFLERHLSGIDGEAGIACRLIVQARRCCTLPVGLHPTLRLPPRVGALKLHAGRFDFGQTYPHELEPGADILASGQSFTDLAAVPHRDGGTIDLRAYPLAENTESLVQLCGVDGQISATNIDEGYRFELHWDSRQLPSCVLWISNAGRSAWPWSRRHYALGIEPVCAMFDLGVAASTDANTIAAHGIPTALPLHPDHPLIIDYRLGVRAVR